MFAALLLMLFPALSATAGDGAAVRIASLESQYRAIETRLAGFETEARRLGQTGESEALKTLAANIKALSRELDELDHALASLDTADLDTLTNNCAPTTDPAKLWESGRLRAYRGFLARMIDERGAILPAGMSRQRAFDYAIAREARGGCFHTALGELFEQGRSQVAAQSAIEADKKKAEEEEQQLAQQQQETQQAEQAAEEARRKKKPPKPPKPRKPSALDAFRGNLAVEEGKAQRPVEPTSSGSGLDGVFDAAAAELVAFRKLEEAKRQRAEAERRLAEVEARIRELERLRQQEDEAFWNNFNAFMGAFGDALARQQPAFESLEQASRPVSPAEPQKAFDNPLGIGQPSAQPPTRQPTPKKVRKTVSRQHGCYQVLQACWSRCETGGAGSACRKNCMNPYNACLDRVCPDGWAPGHRVSSGAVRCFVYVYE